MKRALIGLWCCSVAGVLAAQTARVQVVVSVREGSRPIEELTADDFAVRDNGTLQRVTLARLDAVPLDLTLVVDTKVPAANVADRFEKDVMRIARSLRPDDRLALVRVDTLVEELRPMLPVSAQSTAVPRWEGTGLSSLHDAIIAALVRRTEVERVHVVIVVTDGTDTISVNTADRVREVASRSAALLQIVTVRSPATGGAAFASRPPRFRDANVLILAEAAEQSGGELRSPGLFGDGDLVTLVTRVLTGVRQSYLLTFAPSDVERAGWHELSVSVARAPNATVRARRGYHVN